MSNVTTQKRKLAQEALHQSLNLRKKAGLDPNQPICIYDLCDKLNVTVRFVEYSMEGIYVKEEEPVILVSALRPFPRRNFTCAHELGHHVFGHGTTVDELIENLDTTVFRPEEFLVDSFAGFLLMPILGVRKAFTSRGWNPSSATSHQIFTIACSFGVGYETLIAHLTYNLKTLSHSQAELLLKSKPKTIRQEILGHSSQEPLIIADEHWSLPTIDAEVGSLLLLPSTAEATKETITLQTNHPRGRLFQANCPGIVRVYCPNTQWAVFVRVSRFQFIGLSKYRHLEEVNDE